MIPRKSLSRWRSTRVDMFVGGLRDGKREAAMCRRTRSSGFRPCLLAGLTVLVLAPGFALAETLHFRNETPIPVVVQGACVLRGALVRDRPYLLQPTDKSPAITLPGNKVITIYDAKVPSRVLFQGVIPAGTDDQIFNIQVDGARLKIEKQRPKRTERTERP
jgi:hypothetical protein